MRNRVSGFDIWMKIGILTCFAGAIATFVSIVCTGAMSRIVMCILYAGQFTIMMSKVTAQAINHSSKLSKVRIVGLITAPIALLLYASLYIWQYYVLYYTAIAFGILGSIPFIILLFAVATGKVNIKIDTDTTTDSDSSAEQTEQTVDGTTDTEDTEQ